MFRNGLLRVVTYAGATKVNQIRNLFYLLKKLNFLRTQLVFNFKLLYLPFNSIAVVRDIPC